LATHPHLETLFFPPASSQLNPQEHVWSLARATVSHNHTLPDLPDLPTLRDAFLHDLGTHRFPFDWLVKYAPPILCNR
jgi:transposase